MRGFDRAAMAAAPFTAADFTAAPHGTAEEKARFANSLCRFMAGGFTRAAFTKVLYNRLMHLFGHIAHYDANGFHGEFFTNHGDTARFLEQAMRYPAWGRPHESWCDVEEAVRARITASGIWARCARRMRTRSRPPNAARWPCCRRSPRDTCPGAAGTRGYGGPRAARTARVPADTGQTALFA